MISFAKSMLGYSSTNQTGTHKIRFARFCGEYLVVATSMAFQVWHVDSSKCMFSRKIPEVREVALLPVQHLLALVTFEQKSPIYFYSITDYKVVASHDTPAPVRRIQEAKNSTVVLLLDGTVQFYNAQLTLVKQLKSFTIRATLFATQQEAKEKTQQLLSSLNFPLCVSTNQHLIAYVQSEINEPSLVDSLNE